MRQYCRFCAFCISDEGFRCTALDKELTSRKVSAVNKCDDFVLSEYGDCETGQRYHPRERKVIAEDQGTQLSLFD